MLCFIDLVSKCIREDFGSNPPTRCGRQSREDFAMTEQERINAALATIGDALTRALKMNGATGTPNGHGGHDHGTHGHAQGAESWEPGICTPKMLPERLLIQA